MLAKCISLAKNTDLMAMVRRVGLESAECFRNRRLFSMFRSTKIWFSVRRLDSLGSGFFWIGRALAEGMINAADIDVNVRRLTWEYDFSTRQAIEIVRACLAPIH